MADTSARWLIIFLTLAVGFTAVRQDLQINRCFAAVNYAAGTMLVEDADHTVAWWRVQDACK